MVSDLSYDTAPKHVNVKINVHKQPDVKVKVFAADLDDLEESSKHWHSNGSSKKISLDHVTEEQLECLLVESMTLFNDKGQVKRSR